MGGHIIGWHIIIQEALADMKGDASVLLSQVNDDPISYKRVKLVSDFLDKLDESSPISSIYLSFPSIEDISATYVLSSKLEKSTVHFLIEYYSYRLSRISNY
jgi:hypothetical protein